MIFSALVEPSTVLTSMVLTEFSFEAPADTYAEVPPIEKPLSDENSTVPRVTPVPVEAATVSAVPNFNEPSVWLAVVGASSAAIVNAAVALLLAMSILAPESLIKRRPSPLALTLAVMPVLDDTSLNAFTAPAGSLASVALKVMVDAVVVSSPFTSSWNEPENAVSLSSVTLRAEAVTPVVSATALTAAAIFAAAAWVQPGLFGDVAGGRRSEAIFLFCGIPAIVLAGIYFAFLRPRAVLEEMFRRSPTDDDWRSDYAALLAW